MNRSWFFWFFYFSFVFTGEKQLSKDICATSKGFNSDSSWFRAAIKALILKDSTGSPSRGLSGVQRARHRSLRFVLRVRIRRKLGSSDPLRSAAPNTQVPRRVALVGRFEMAESLRRER